MSRLQRDFVALKEGVEIGMLLKSHQTEFEIQLDDEGADCTDRAENSVESCLSFDQLQKIVNLQVTSDDANEDKDTPFNKYRNKMFNLTKDGKVLKHIVKRGVGPTMHENCVAFVRYRGYFEYQEIPFDSTIAQSGGEDRAIPFDLVEAGLLPGLRSALLSMRKGEEAEFLVHPDLAFGKLGCPPRIPGDATVLFIINVEKFVDRAYMSIVSDDSDMSYRNRFTNVYKNAEDQFMKGNEEFSKDNIISASKLYKQVINLLLNSRIADEKEERTRNRFLVKVYAKLCECFYKERNYKKVCVVAADAIRDCRQETFSNYRLMYLLGYANMMLGDFNGAKKRLQHAGRLYPGSAEVTSSLADLERRKKRALDEEKIMMCKMFQSIKKKPPETKMKELPDRHK